MNEAQRITEWVEQKKESAIALARAVWGFAEPNWRETQSAAAISAALEAEGFALERRPCGMETGFRRHMGRRRAGHRLFGRIRRAARAFPAGGPR